MQAIIHGISNLPGILERVGCGKLFLVVDSSYPFLNIKDALEALPVAGIYDVEEVNEVVVVLVVLCEVDADGVGELERFAQQVAQLVV